VLHDFVTDDGGGVIAKESRGPALAAPGHEFPKGDNTDGSNIGYDQSTEKSL
jgi:hypothetical protein